MFTDVLENLCSHLSWMMTFMTNTMIIFQHDHNYCGLQAYGPMAILTLFGEGLAPLRRLTYRSFQLPCMFSFSRLATIQAKNNTHTQLTQRNNIKTLVFQLSGRSKNQTYAVYDEGKVWGRKTLSFWPQLEAIGPWGGFTSDENPCTEKIFVIFIPT